MEPRISVDLKLEYLKLKSALYDHVNGLPLIELFYKDVVKMLERRIPVGCLLITIVNGEELEKIVTFEHLDQILYESSSKIKLSLGKIGVKEYILASLAPGGETLVLVLYDTKGKIKINKDFLKDVKKFLEEEIKRRLNNYIAREKLAIPEPFVVIIERVLESAPTLRSERQIARELDKMMFEARKMLEKADYDKKAALLRIIEQKDVNFVFQPIVNLKDKQIYGFEALARCSLGEGYNEPETLFTLAESFNLLKDLEKTCALNAIDVFFNFSKNSKKLANKKLFINLSPPSFTVLLSDEFLEKIHAYEVPPDYIVIELTEKFLSLDSEENEAYFDILKRVAKQIGFEIAVDDVGTGYSTLERVASLSPHYIKYDRVLFKNIHKDPVKQELLKTIFDFSKKINSKLIVEGVENNKDYEFAVKLGIEFMQGFLFGRPLKLG
ncbi:MAG: EAL domain-containing protein [bacterium]|nr:EAL domain-containing protein [bacterium]